MDEDNNNPIIKNTGDINIDTRTYFQKETQNITQNGDYIYEQNEDGAWHLESKPQDSTEPTDVQINIPPTINFPINLTKIEIHFPGSSMVINISSLNRILCRNNNTVITIPNGYVAIAGRNDNVINAYEFLVQQQETLTIHENYVYCLINKNSSTLDIVSFTDNNKREWVSCWDTDIANGYDRVIMWKYMYDISDWFTNVN